jgi:Mu transposase, C-terminal domain
VRLGSNDYSVDPTAIGRRVLVRADLDRVRVWCDGGGVADHERVWARRQTISDPVPVRAAQLLMQRSPTWPPSTSSLAKRM